MHDDRRGRGSPGIASEVERSTLAELELDDDARALLALYRDGLEPSAGAEERVHAALEREREAAAVLALPAASRRASRGASRGASRPASTRGRLVVGLVGLAAGLVLVTRLVVVTLVAPETSASTQQAPFTVEETAPGRGIAESTKMSEKTYETAGSGSGSAASRGESRTSSDVTDEVPAAAEDTTAAPSTSASAPRIRRPRRAVADAPARERGPSAAAPTSAEEPEPGPGVDFAGELRLVRGAERRLRAGDPEEALRLLAQHERDYPGGQLEPERTASRITALCHLGRVAEAGRLSAEFLDRWPSSHLARRVRGACDEVP